jgi:hypothetical protein
MPTGKPKGKTGLFVRMRHVVQSTDTPMFSLGTGPAVPASKRLSVALLMHLVNKHLQKLAPGISVMVKESVTELGYPENGAKDAFINGTVFLFRDRIASVADARDTLFHEILHLCLHRFMPRSQYIITMGEVYRTDPRLRMMADAWIKSEEGVELRASGASEEFVKARGVDEGLAHMADRVANSACQAKPQVAWRSQQPSWDSGKRIIRAVEDVVIYPSWTSWSWRWRGRSVARRIGS